MYRFLRIPKFFPPFLHFHCFNRTLISGPKLEFVLNEVEDLHSLRRDPGDGAKAERAKFLLSPIETKKLQISHPWPVWIDLMEQLLKKGYFEGSSGYPFNGSEMGTKDSNRIRTACLNFARDRFDFIRYLSRKDIYMIVGSGCPSTDRKVVNSGKRLRAHVAIDEGLVCSSCNLRGSCERAYIKARNDEGGRTVDVMRILMTYGLDPFIGSVENKLCLNNSIKESVRRLLTGMVELSTKELDSEPSKASPSKRLPYDPDHSIQRKKGNISVPMKQGDRVCPKCNFLNFAKNIKCLRCDGLFLDRLQELREDQDHLPLKKGDWLCDKCNFLNFAKNTRCLQCKEKPPKRDLNPGEWECESCNYINFRRNMVCLKCDWKRPKASNNSDASAAAQRGDGGFHQHCRMNFVRNDDEDGPQPSIEQQRQIQKEGLNFWGRIEDGDDDVYISSPCYKSSEFDDFPIKGGKSVVSQNPQLWKEEMSKRRTESTDLQVHDDLDFEVLKKLRVFESTDDEEMAGWFGYGKKIETDRQNSN